jgi:hypothetical protein
MEAAGQSEAMEAVDQSVDVTDHDQSESADFVEAHQGNTVFVEPKQSNKAFAEP